MGYLKVKIMIIALSGKVGSGKTTLTAELASRLEWPRISFGDYVRSYAIQHQIEPTRENLQNMGERLLAEDAKQFCNNVLNQVEWRPYGKLIIDGVRHVNVLALIKNLVEPFKLVHVHVEAEEQNRLERLEACYSFTDIQRIDSHSTELDVKDKLKQQADFNLQTDLPVNLLVDQLIRALQIN